MKNIQNNLRQCATCKEFNIDGTYRFPNNTYCRGCSRVYAKTYYEKNRVKDANRRRKHFLDHPELREKRDEQIRKYYNTEKMREYYKAYQKRTLKIDGEKRKVRLKARRTTKIDQPCYFCEGVKNLDRHHYDYSKPTEFFVLCRKCHKKFHFIHKLMVE